METQEEGKLGSPMDPHYLSHRSLRKNVRHRHLQPCDDVFQHVERDVLIAHLDSVQRGRGDTHFLLERGKRHFTARFLEERSELFAKLLTYSKSLWLLLSHMWDILVASAR